MGLSTNLTIFADNIMHLVARSNHKLAAVLILPTDKSIDFMARKDWTANPTPFDVIFVSLL